MCLVIDANRAADFCAQKKPYMKLLLGWINRGGKVVSGGDLEGELFRVAAMRGLIGEWSRRGSLIRLSKDDVQSKSRELKDVCRSNDAHVLAVTIIAGASLVVTEDNNLILDLKDRDIVGERKRIYKENSANPVRMDRHRALLASTDCP